MTMYLFNRVIAFILYYTGAINVIISFFRRFGKYNLIVSVIYHRIVTKESAYLDKGPVVQKNKHDFEKEMIFLSKHFQFISVNEIGSFLNGNRFLQKHAVAITLDDGYQDNYINAYPILRQLKIPATIYLTTLPIDGNNKLWFDELEECIMKTRNRFFSLKDVNIYNFIMNNDQDKIRLNNTLCRELKKYDSMRRDIILNEIKKVLEVDEDKCASVCCNRRALAWREIRQMDADGIIFGAHTHTHPILSKLPIAEAQKEIKISKEIIEKYLGHDVRDFAFPNGRKEDFSDELKVYCRRIGFETVASVHYGGEYKISDPYDIPRIGSYSPIEMFAMQILILILKSMFPSITRRKIGNSIGRKVSDEHGTRIHEA